MQRILQLQNQLRTQGVRIVAIGGMILLVSTAQATVKEMSTLIALAETSQMETAEVIRADLPENQVIQNEREKIKKFNYSEVKEFRIQLRKK